MFQVIGIGFDKIFWNNKGTRKLFNVPHRFKLLSTEVFLNLGSWHVVIHWSVRLSNLIVVTYIRTDLSQIILIYPGMWVFEPSDALMYSCKSVAWVLLKKTCPPPSLSQKPWCIINLQRYVLCHSPTISFHSFTFIVLKVHHRDRRVVGPGGGHVPPSPNILKIIKI